MCDDDVYVFGMQLCVHVIVCFCVLSLYVCAFICVRVHVCMCFSVRLFLFLSVHSCVRAWAHVNVYVVPCRRVGGTPM